MGGLAYEDTTARNQDWVAAFNQRNVHAAAELYHEDATNFQAALGDPTVGRGVILNDLLSFFHAFPDTFTDVENLFEEGEWVMLEWLGAVLGEVNSPLRHQTAGLSSCVGAASSTSPTAGSGATVDIGTAGTKEGPRRSELFQLPSRFFLTPFAFRYALRARSSYPSRAAR
jgi:hypothetical protein